MDYVHIGTQKSWLPPTMFITYPVDSPCNRLSPGISVTVCGKNNLGIRESGFKYVTSIPAAF
ncbi:MAG: hypothetical protein STSR0009_26050 [Methanoregula sp.]